MNILIVLVFSLAAAAIVLAVINWIYLISISSRTSELEQDIIKKTQEFDNFKKEKPASRQQTQVIPAADTAHQETPEPVLSNEPIQIMRNVGGSFEKAEKHNFKEVHYKPLSNKSSAGANGLNEAIPYGSETADPSPVSAMPLSEENSSDPCPDVMATVSEQPEPQNPYPFTILKLYSESAKDADFNYLWKSISALLQSRINTAIGIDFAGINFLYDKELAYLVKIYHIVTSSGSKLHFLNCDTDLVTILSNYPQLQHLVLKQGI